MATRGKATADVVAQLERIEREGGDGRVTLPGRIALDVSSLGKVFFPEPGWTKGDLMRYYARVADAILPVLRDRPLVLKRHPNGVEGKFFFQQKAPERPPRGVRVADVETEAGVESRLIGGSLATLLHLVQLGTISMDPWISRLRSLDHADHLVLDLDPGPKAGFAGVVRAAGWVREELEALGMHGVPKTSGSRGIHIYLPLPPRTTDERATALGERIAAAIARAHPKEATIERAVKARPAGAVYVDYLQNVRGKSVAAAYSVRATSRATVSTPLRWDEIDDRLDPSAFTIETVPARLAKLGDLWAEGMRKRNAAAAIDRACGRRAR